MYHKSIRTISVISSTILVALALSIVPLTSKVYADSSNSTGSIYLSPASQNIQNGSSFTLNLRVTPGTPIDTVTANVNFDASKLSLTGVNCTGSPFTTTVQCVSGNPAQITSAILGSSINTDSFVASLTFKATAGSGTSTISVSGDTAYAGSAIGAGTAGTTVTFTTPTCPTGQTGTPPNCVTPSSGSGSSSDSSSSDNTNNTDTSNQTSGDQTSTTPTSDSSKSAANAQPTTALDTSSETSDELPNTGAVNMVWIFIAVVLSGFLASEAYLRRHYLAARLKNL